MQCAFPFILKSLKVICEFTKPHPYDFFFWHTSQWAHCAQCIMELLNGWFYQGNWSHRCQGVNWDYSFTTYWQILNRCGKLCRVKWASPRALKRKSVCGPVTLHEWLKWRNTLETTISKEKEEEEGTSWTFAVELECASAQSLSKVTW